MVLWFWERNTGWSRLGGLRVFEPHELTQLSLAWATFVVAYSTPSQERSGVRGIMGLMIARFATVNPTKPEHVVGEAKLHTTGVLGNGLSSFLCPIMDICNADPKCLEQGILWVIGPIQCAVTQPGSLHNHSPWTRRCRAWSRDPTSVRN
jgi:hypothetical protein